MADDFLCDVLILLLVTSLLLGSIEDGWSSWLTWEIDGFYSRVSVVLFSEDPLLRRTGLPDSCFCAFDWIDRIEFRSLLLFSFS